MPVPPSSSLSGAGALPGVQGTLPGEMPPTQPGGPPVNLCLSDWIVGPHPPGCCGPVGGNGPVQMEIYLQSGLDFPFSDGVFGHTLKEPGWDIQGGGRVLFFNPDVTAAWTVDLSVNNINNHAGDQTEHVLVRDLASDQLPPIDVTIRSLNRTYANAALGREWYLSGPADYPGIVHGVLPNWRVGFDVGGRWGSAKLDLNEIRHRTDVIYGVFASAHSDLEFPCGCCVFYTGLRVEFGYTWSDILQRQSDVYDVNVLFNIGVRY
jgi:hypothetical protein